MVFEYILLIVVSFWVGDVLIWLYEFCLVSYVYFGYEVVLFYVGFFVLLVFVGVVMWFFFDIWDYEVDGYGDVFVVMLFDLFCLYLMKQMDMVWIDMDMLCLQLMFEVDYYVGYE